MIQISFNQDSAFGFFYIVPTPIGNLNDFSLRAQKILTEVDIILCEDMRVTLKLLNHFNIKNKLWSLHKFNENLQIDKIIAILKEKKNFALVSDSGYPLISDPGNELVKSLIANNISIIALPGPSACLTALVASGLTTNNFFFYGFLKNKSSQKRIKELQLLKIYPTSIIFYESPNRIIAMLNDLKIVFGNLNVTVAKEITKVYEQYYRGKLEIVIQELLTSKLVGEFVIIIENSQNIKKILLEDDIKKEIINFQTKYPLISNLDVIEIISYKFQLPKKTVYTIFNLVKENSND